MIPPYRYTDFGIPAKVEAAINTKDYFGLMATHFFKEGTVYVLYPDNTTTSYSITSSSPKNLFINVPAQFDAAADQNYPTVVFFKGMNYYSYDVQLSNITDTGQLISP